MSRYRSHVPTFGDYLFEWRRNFDHFPVEIEQSISADDASPFSPIELLLANMMDGRIRATPLRRTDGRRMWECFCECDAASMGELRSKRKKGGGNSPVSCVFALILQRGRERESIIVPIVPSRGRERDPFKVATSSITHAAAAVVVVISPLLPHSFPF